ncbi:hypothetical protein MMC17_000707 [Xylographa soralifera]|nr:hypothetical protein [Xylographa soralifera]
MANFNDMPPEVRLRIYSYLLLSERTVVPLAAGGSLKENILRSHYETALFTVNKKISNESISYFYSQNAFVAVETNMTRFLSECCRAIPMNFGHCTTQFKGYVLKLQFYQFTGHTSMRYSRCAFAVFSRRYLRNFIRLFEVNHSPLRHLSLQNITTRLDIVLKTKDGRFKDKPGIESSLVNDLKILQGFPEAIDNHMILTFRSVISYRSVCMDLGNLEEANQTITKGDQFHQLQDYDGARGEYLIALSLVTAPASLDETYLAESYLDTLDRLYVELRSKMSVLDSEQKRYESAIVEADKALQLPGNREISELVPISRMIELYVRWATTLADNGQYEEAILVLENTGHLAVEHPVVLEKLAEMRLLHKGHRAR